MKKNNFSRFEKFDLHGKLAIITGAAGLLGLEHCRALLEAGANIVLWDIDQAALNSTKSILVKEFSDANILTQLVDVTNEEKVRFAFQEIRSTGNNVTILINNAAINPNYQSVTDLLFKSRLENFDLNDWNFQINVGLTGAFICSKIIGSRMAELKQGVILNIGSDLSIIAPDQRIYRLDNTRSDLQPVKPVTYSVIKHGLIGLTKYLATYWRLEGVRVNALSPGGVLENQSPDFISKVTNLIPMGRLAEKHEYKSAVQFLCSEASSYMTGQNLIIDGGRSIW
jgi:NAD(P)-dependent dehydrogenase (short-subunit alcohol dehydrogenase family)